MIFKIHNHIQRLLQRYALSRYYPVFTGGVACGCAVSAIPFVPVLMAAVLISPAQWRSITLFTSLGSALGGVFVLLIFHHLGWVQVMQAHPEWFASDIWQMMLHWLTDWGYGHWRLLLQPLTTKPRTLFLSHDRSILVGNVGGIGRRKIDQIWQCRLPHRALPRKISTF